MHLATLVLVAALVATGSAQQLIAPLLPTEFATNVIQHKWNLNGGLVNNTYSGSLGDMKCSAKACLFPDSSVHHSIKGGVENIWV